MRTFTGNAVGLQLSISKDFDSPGISMIAIRKPALLLVSFIVLIAAAMPSCGSVKLDAEPEAPISCTIPIDPATMPPLPSGLPTAIYAGAPVNTKVFEHGVASGDPTVSAVILWTRVSPPDATQATVPVFFEVALDEEFTQRVAAGEVTTHAARDYTVKVDAVDLQWGRNYFYRFQAF
jgi:hypothetical protein